MEFNFNNDLADAVTRFSDGLRKSPEKRTSFEDSPTETLKTFLRNQGVGIPDPDLFHAHAIKVGDQLPSEPDRATRDRFIYIFRSSGLFEFKVVPGSPTGDDNIMKNPTRACCCCNCCVVEL